MNRSMIRPRDQDGNWFGSLIDIPTGGSVTVTLTMVINASASAQEFINNAYVRNRAYR